MVMEIAPHRTAPMSPVKIVEVKNKAMMRRCESDAHMSNITGLTEVTSFSEQAEDDLMIDTGDDELRVIQIDNSDQITAPPKVKGCLCLPKGLPSQVFCVEESSTSEGEDTMSIQDRLQRAEFLAKSYKETLHSTEHLISSLHHTLRGTQKQTEKIAMEHASLQKTLEEIDQGATNKKVVTCFCLCFYLLGGSEYALVAVVALYLVDDLINLVV